MGCREPLLDLDPLFTDAQVQFVIVRRTSWRGWWCRKPHMAWRFMVFWVLIHSSRTPPLHILAKHKCCWHGQMYPVQARLLSTPVADHDADSWVSPSPPCIMADDTQDPHLNFSKKIVLDIVFSIIGPLLLSPPFSGHKRRFWICYSTPGCTSDGCWFIMM